MREEEKHEEAKQGKAGLSLFFQLFSLPGGRGGNVKINVDRIAAKSGQNGGNFGAAQSSSFGAGSCGNKVKIATFLCFAHTLLPVRRVPIHFTYFATLPMCQTTRQQAP